MTEKQGLPEASSLERLIPLELNAEETTGSETLKVHLERYEFAKKHLVPGTVLDIACGVGYGTVLLAGSHMVTRVVGVDVSGQAIRYASQHYNHERASYVCSSAHEFKSEEAFDNIVSLETIEHLDHPNEFFSRLVALLKPGGRLVASAPVTPSVDANPHHKSNFSARTFARLGTSHSLRPVDTLKQIQPYSAVAIVARREKRAADLRRSIPLFYLRNPSHLFLRLWSILRDGFVNKYLTIAWEKPRSAANRQDSV
jgi:2-polyprenyl-3-methyl-5-hydroxy-6-metoxy-1,4-benzoquinol methylase